MFSWAIAFLVFLLYFSLDGMYVYYTIQMTQLNSLKAACAAVVIYALGTTGVLIYTTNPLYIIFILLGAFLGTFLVVEYEKWKKNK